jgi:hypothetical protein
LHPKFTLARRKLYEKLTSLRDLVIKICLKNILRIYQYAFNLRMSITILNVIRIKQYRIHLVILKYALYLDQFNLEYLVKLLANHLVEFKQMPSYIL